MSDQPIPGPASDHLSRRTFLRAAGATGAVALSPAVLRKRAEAQETPSPLRPDPAAKRGGTLRYAVHTAPSHFDVHQSGTVANIGAQSPMYDTLLRRHPKDGQGIIPDLAWKWDISPDGKKYTFYLRKGVKFHDGADFTAEDVKATYERIVRPPKGVVIPRSSLFTTVSDIVVLDPHKLEFYHMMPFSPELGGSFLSGKLDYARLLDPVSWRKAKEMPNVTAAAFNQSVMQAFWMNMKKKPLADARVRRAIHLAMDRPTLVEVVKDTAPMQIGGFVYPFHEMSTPKAELEKRLGYQKDVKPAVQEARRLMQEAGYGQGIKGLDFVVRDIQTFKLWAVAIQAMLKEHINIETNLRTVQTSVWFDEAAAGNFDLAISAIVSSLMDPSDYFTAWYGANGPQNYSGWNNEQFQALAKQIERELDDTKRKAMVRKAEDIMEQDPPLIPISYEQIYDAYYNKVKGQNPSTFFGIYDVVRWDNVWLAQS